jgi:hypothetical protein
MPSGISPAVVAAPVPAIVSVDRLGPVTAAGPSSREVRRGAPGAGHIAVTGTSLSRGLRRLGSVSGGLVAIFAFSYAFPLAIHAVGIPVALLVRLGIWVVRAL